MSIFRFKKFEVVNERSAMKVNTDGVLLGAAMTISKDDCRCLDIGTGTGTVALMAAQRLQECRTEDYSVDAVEIDGPSAEEASANFMNSPWKDNLKSYHCALRSFNDIPQNGYDLIFSNPPYFEDSLPAPETRRNNARHTADSLSYRDIFEFASGSLSVGGRLSLILPSDQETDIRRNAGAFGFHLFRIVRVRTVPRKTPCRIIVEFSRSRCDNPSDTVLTIQNEGKYTEEYLSLTHDFYLFA